MRPSGGRSLLAAALMLLAGAGCENPDPPPPPAADGADAPAAGNEGFLADGADAPAAGDEGFLADGDTGAAPAGGELREAPLPEAASPRVAALEARLAGLPAAGEEAVALRLELARERLTGGDAGGALAAAQQALADQRRLWNADTVAGIVSPGSHRQAEWLPAPLLLIVQAAVSLAMQGECVARRRPAGCILPLSSAAAHVDTAPAATAMSYALELLDLRPHDPLVRWLLNLAAAQAGAADRVPLRWRAAPATLLDAAGGETAAGGPRFRPRTESLGVEPAAAWPPDSSMARGSAAAPAWSVRADLDGDGHADAVTAGPEGPRLHRGGPGDARLDVTAGSGLVGPRPAGAGCLLDADGDGLQDLLIASREASPAQAAAALMSPHRPATAGTPRLYRNRGGLHFEDVTAAAGLDRVHLTGAVVCADLNGDGAADIFLAASSGAPGVPLPALLFLNDRRGSFRDVTAEAGAGLLLPAAGAAASDLDGDGDLDLAIRIGGTPAGEEGFTILLENRGPSGVAALP